MVTIKTACGAFLSISLGLVGCTSVEKVLPQDGPTMLEIYDGHVAATGTPASSVIPLIGDSTPVWQEVGLDTELAAYTRTVETEINTLFPELPNPRIVMYVFPHLTDKDRLPVPGYATAFSMYERSEFALPGEVARAASSDGPRQYDGAETAPPHQRAVQRIVDDSNGE